MKQEWLTPKKFQRTLADSGLPLSLVTIRNWITKIPDIKHVRTPGGHLRIDPVDGVDKFLTYFDEKQSQKTEKA